MRDRFFAKDQFLDQFDKNLISEAEKILDEEGFDLATVFRRTLKKIIQEKNIDFLLSSAQSNRQEEQCHPPTKECTLIEHDEPSTNSQMQNDRVRMTKNMAIAQFRREGIAMQGTTTFASKNNMSPTYWANPYFSVLSNGQWNLILNDWHSREIHLFVIPANSMKSSQFIPRHDKPELMDIQIMYKDPTYTDMRSKISFLRFWKKTITY